MTEAERERDGATPEHDAVPWWGTRGASVRYGRHFALDHVSFRAAGGRVSAVVGGDGAGKSTLLRCLAGALAPSGGEVRRPDPRRIGYLAPGSGCYPDLTVEENLAFRAAAYRVAPAVARQRAAEYLERTGLAAARHRLAGRLSGGMRQKLGVIAAMLHEPSLLVLDEPTTGVDPVSRADLWWLIARAAAAVPSGESWGARSVVPPGVSCGGSWGARSVVPPGGTAVVVSTTYLDEAQRAAWVLVLDSGREIAAGTPAEIAASVPGTIRATSLRPAGEEGRRAWRRGGGWRVWDPESEDPGGERDTAGAAVPGDPAGTCRIQPDLQDAVTVAELARELGLTGGDVR